MGVLVLVNLCVEDQQLRKSIYNANEDIDADCSKAGTQHAVRLFNGLVAPALWESMRSNLSAEKSSALLYAT